MLLLKNNKNLIVSSLLRLCLSVLLLRFCCAFVYNMYSTVFSKSRLSPFKPNDSKDKEKSCRSVPGSMATLRHIQRERKSERGREKKNWGEAGGMDSCSEADCTGWLSYQGSSHASKSQIKHPHLAFQPATLLQLPAPSLFYLV